MRVKKLSWQTIVAILLVVIYIILISVQPINVYATAEYDDLLFVEQATNILNGKWLGKYDHATLVKGVFTPLFMALMGLLKIPFILGQNMLYVLSISLLVGTIKKKITNKNVLLVIFAFLLFNPVMFSSDLCRMYRDGIYTALVMFLVSAILGIFLNRKESVLKLVGYHIVLGLSFTSIFLCREETIWGMPFIVVSTIATILFIIYDSKCLYKVKKLLLYIIPIGIFLISVITVCSLNYKYYGVFQLNQYWSREFKEAYGAMTRVLPTKEFDKVPVTREVIKELTDVCPTFKPVGKEILSSGFRWSLCGDGVILEIQGGWYHWALMEAMQRNGYFKTATKANDYYTTVANEINSACDRGLFENCLPYKRVSNTARFGIKELWNAFIKSKDTIKFQHDLTAVDIRVINKDLLNTNIGKANAQLFKDIGNTEMFATNAYYSDYNHMKLKVLEGINKVYSATNKYIFYISITLYFVVLYKFIKNPKELYEEILILTGIFALYYSRIYVLTFTAETMWTTAVNPMYMASAYPLQFAFSSLAITWGLREIKFKNIKNKVKKMVRK